MLSQEANAHVNEALGEMSELDRQILLLKYTENWSYREIALHLGVQDETIEYRLMKARKNLRHRLRALVDEGTGL